eukprot:40676-Amphidinium_carterae.2
MYVFETTVVTAAGVIDGVEALAEFTGSAGTGILKHRCLLLLSLACMASVELGTLLALRSARTVQICVDRGTPFIFENLLPRNGCTSIALLPGIDAILKRNNNVTSVRVQLVFSELRCMRPRRKWAVLGIDVVFLSPHARLEGK